MKSMKATIRNWIKRRAWADSMLSAIQSRRSREFEPCVVDLPTGGRFFVATPMARRWYVPMPDATRREYEWVTRNLNLRNQRILDCGAHHGQYSVVLGLAAGAQGMVAAADPYPLNCLVQEINAKLNKLTVRIEQCAVSDSPGLVHFSDQSNGRIVAGGGLTVGARTVQQLMPKAQVIKMDIEGAEYRVVPQALETTAAHTWILEIHPSGKARPETLIKLFNDHGYSVGWFGGGSGDYRTYVAGATWPEYATIIARR